MKSNPFYFASAAAMLAGCYILSQALKLQPGNLVKLLVLMGVVQVYECLLVGLGLLLVKKRVPRDGLTLLGLETVFLVDATLLANECATVDVRAGAAAAAVAVTLAVAKLLVVNRYAPRVLSPRAALLLGVQAVLAQTIPIVISQAASGRWLTSAVLYGLWWVTLGLPLMRQRLLEELDRAPYGRARFWTALPSVSVFIHLVAAGWVHDIPFQPAFLAPVLLGLAMSTRRSEWVYWALPTSAFLLSLDQAALGIPLSASEVVSPARLVLIAIGAGLVALAWTKGLRWRLGLGATLVLTGVLGRGRVSTLLSRLWQELSKLLRFAADHLPKDAADWGVVTVAFAFVLLGLGLHRSLRTVRQEINGGDKW
jgi:hypothetical protein